MTFYNRVILTGRVATTPRRRYRPDGSPVIQFPLELNHSKESTAEVMKRPRSGHAPNRYGSGQEGRSLIDIVAFGELAELKFNLLQSGQHLLVVGQLKQRHWQTPEGKRYTRTEIIATDLRKVEEADQPAGQRKEKMTTFRRGERDEETF